MKIAEKSFTVDGVEFPAGSFVITASARHAVGHVRRSKQLGLTAAALSSAPSVPMHDADVPRIAMYSSWTGTQEIGWVRYTFDQFGIPYDLIYKERVTKGQSAGRLRRHRHADADRRIARPSLRPPAARPVPYLKTDKFKFLGMYGESPDITGGMGGEGVDAFARVPRRRRHAHHDGRGGRASRPSWASRARSTRRPRRPAQFYAPRPIVNAEIVRPDHPVFYGYADKNAADQVLLADR